MREKLKRLLAWFKPTHTSAFLALGWLCAAVLMSIGPVIQVMTGTWLVPYALVILVYVPLWWRATKVREHNMELQRIVNDFNRVLSEAEKLETTKELNENVRDDATE